MAVCPTEMIHHAVTPHGIFSDISTKLLQGIVLLQADVEGRRLDPVKVLWWTEPLPNIDVGVTGHWCAVISASWASAFINPMLTCQVRWGSLDWGRRGNPLILEG